MIGKSEQTRWEGEKERERENHESNIMPKG